MMKPEQCLIARKRCAITCPAHCPRSQANKPPSKLKKKTVYFIKLSRASLAKDELDKLVGGNPVRVLSASLAVDNRGWIVAGNVGSYAYIFTGDPL